MYSRLPQALQQKCGACHKIGCAYSHSDNSIHHNCYNRAEIRKKTSRMELKIVFLLSLQSL